MNESVEAQKNGNLEESAEYLFQTIQNFRKALKWCDITLSINPYYIETYEVRAEAYLGLGQEEKAEEVFDKVDILSKQPSIKLTN